MLRFALIFVVLFIGTAFAECVSVENITKCARVPRTLKPFLLGGGEYTDNSWNFTYDGQMFSGQYADCVKKKVDSECECHIAYPFNAIVSFTTGAMFFSNSYEACSNINFGEMVMEFVFQSKSVGDACPDGFYTVPYDLSCGEELVEVDGVPSCQDDVSGDFCTIENTSVPCGAGITKVRTGTGLVFPLWAEKYTEPALCVKYNGTVCYGNLVSGGGINSININYNGRVYHLAD